MFGSLKQRKEERKMREARELDESYEHAKVALALEQKRTVLIDEMQKLKYKVRVATGVDKEKYEDELREINHQEYELSQVIKAHDEKRRK